MSNDRKNIASPPSGTRDFFGPELRRRQAAIGSITQVFEAHGFDPLQTPAFERIEVLTGKYGEDEKLIFKIAKRGAKEASGEADLALRYDLTVPLARFVAGHGALAARTLRSYRIGPVWRADRPARGRFREFFQCDVDLVGSTSALADAEVQLVVAEALHALGLSDFVIHLNSRRVLAGLVQAYRVPDALGHAFLVAMDKLGKVGVDGVTAELSARGADDTTVGRVEEDLRADDRAAAVATRLGSSDVGRDGLQEVRCVRDLVEPSLAAGRILFDPFIARGLDYYTGPVFEVFHEGANSLPLSIASGGRYDELIGTFAGHPVPACGGSLGFERILLMLEDGDGAPSGSQVLVTVWDDAAQGEMVALAGELRRQGFRTEISLHSGGLGGQLRYATHRGIEVCVIRGPAERDAGSVAVKDMATGQQTNGPRSSVVDLVRAVLHAG